MSLFESANLIELIKAVGYIGIFAIIFVESGLFFGFFLPGDSLLFTAGFLASQGFLNVYILIFIIFVAAVLGDNVGYSFGRSVGQKLFKKPESAFFKPDNLVKAHAFYEKYGAKTIVIARFMPFVRTFAPIVAGIGQMRYSTFLMYNLFGGALWSFSLIISGFFLGRIIPNVDRYLLPIIGIIVIASIIPALKHLVLKK